MRMIYWCNLNLRDKYFGYKPEDELVYVGSLDADHLDDMYQKCNRIEEPTPMIDEAEAPSMSVGDVVQVRNLVPGGDWDSEWYAVASFGFDKIEEPKEERLVIPHDDDAPGRKAGDVISLRVDRINREGH